MLDFINIFTASASVVSVTEALLTIFLSVILGTAIGFTYRLTTDTADYSENFFLTLILVPAVVAVIILLIGSNIARAFSLAGAFSIIRFRSAAGNPKDITYVLFTMAAGLACGVGGYVYALLFTAVLCVVMIAFYFSGVAKTGKSKYILKITVPEDLNFKGVFDEVIGEFADTFKLSKIKTADMGSVFELTYNISMADNKDAKELMDAVRCKNGNLTVQLTLDAMNREF